MRKKAAARIPCNRQSTTEACGGRVEVLRQMIRLSRKAFSEKHGISPYTLQSWEAGKVSLTLRAAKRLLPVFQKEGIFCTVEWLLHGMGQPPQLINMQAVEISETSPLYNAPATDSSMTHELLTFRNLNPNVMDLIVNDDGMEPYYQQGDLVAGIRRIDEAIGQLIGKECIVQTARNEILLRRIKGNRKSGTYDLMCWNMESQMVAPTLYEQTLVCAAAVIWQRRPDVWPRR